MAYIVPAGTTIDQAQARLPSEQAELNTRREKQNEIEIRFKSKEVELESVKAKVTSNKSIEEATDLQLKAKRYEDGIAESQAKVDQYAKQEADLRAKGYAKGTSLQKFELYEAVKGKQAWQKANTETRAEYANIKQSLGKYSSADVENAKQLERELINLQNEGNAIGRELGNARKATADQQDIVNGLQTFISGGGTGQANAATTSTANTGTDAASSSSTASDDRFKNQGQTNSVSEVSSGASNPSRQRLAAAGLKEGGLAGGPLPTREVPVAVATQRGPTLSLLEDDWRVRISLANSSKLFYKSAVAGIQNALRSTNGVVFPYTPSINVTHTARYGEQKLTHSNYANYFYEGSEVQAIQVQGEFTVQTPEEGKYLLAAVMFFRSCTKMFFGKTNQQPLAGSPPPIVFLHGYGKYVFPAVPCVITQFQQTMPGDVDYLEVSHFIDEVNPTGFANSQGQFKSEIQMLNSAATRVPTNSTLSVTLQPVYSRKSVHEDFNLDRFASGELLVGRGGFI